MQNQNQPKHAVQVRNEILIALRMIYPAALQSGIIMRSLLAVFPTLEWNHFNRDIYYLLEKGYIGRVIASSEQDARMTPWRKRWFRITASGLEIAECAIRDPALNPDDMNAEEQS